MMNLNINKFSPPLLRLIFYVLLLAKTGIYIFIYIAGNDFFGGGNDSEYYDSYAKGDIDHAVNIWPIFLRKLNELGVYSRQGVSLVLAITGFLIVPFLGASIVVHDNKWYNQRLRSKYFWLTAIIISLYPTIIYYTTDIYRDVMMVFTFMFGIRLIQLSMGRVSYVKKIWFNSLILFTCLLLYSFRPYLGFAILSSYLASNLNLGYTLSKSSVWLIFVLILNIFFAFGFLEPIIAYRSLFQNEMEGGSNLGITFDSAYSFMYLLILNFVYQIAGFYFTNYYAVFVFFIESIPFLFLLVYVLKNRMLWNATIIFLINFSFIYGIIWLIGNDNLGTAVRLRIFNYISIIISALIIHQKKLKK